MVEGEFPEFLTLEMVLGMLPAERGIKPSEQGLRQLARRLGLGRRLGRVFYLTRAEATQLLLTGSEREPYIPERVTRPPRRTVPTAATERALELSRKFEQQKELEKWGLVPKPKRK